MKSPPALTIACVLFACAGVVHAKGWAESIGRRHASGGPRIDRTRVRRANGPHRTVSSAPAP